VRFDGDTNTLTGRVVTTFGNGLVIGGKGLLVTGSAHEQALTAAGRTVVNQTPEIVNAGC